MNVRSILYVLGTLLVVTGLAMLLPAGCTLFYDNEGDLIPILLSAAISVGAGFPFWFLFRKNQELNIRDAFFIATFGWVLVSAVSGLPFMIHGSIPSFADAFFEMMSGYTTTGSTILTNIEALPHGLLLWRSTTHLLGGMGFLTLTVIFLPQGMGGLRIFRAESSPGQSFTGEKFAARGHDTVVYMWGIYLALNLLQIVLMMAGGMSLFDAMCHAFGTLSTSGYSPYNQSIGYYNNAYFDWVITVFMFMGGMTFMLFYHIAKGEWRPIRINTELRWYIGFVLFFCLSVSLFLWHSGTYDFADSLRYASFQVVSLLSTTGFTTADYELWPKAAQMFLYAVFFVGGCSGSTSSGIKIVHYVIAFKFISATVKKMFQPLAVTPVRLNGRQLDPMIIDLALCFFILNILLVLGGGCFMALSDDMDYVTGVSSVLATLMNIGPGFGDVGPSKNFAFISDTGKWFLSYNMLVGRLEAFSVLVLFFPSFWRK